MSRVTVAGGCFISHQVAKKIFCQKDFSIPPMDPRHPEGTASGVAFPLSCTPRSVCAAERENSNPEGKKEKLKLKNMSFERV